MRRNSGGNAPRARENSTRQTISVTRAASASTAAKVHMSDMNPQKRLTSLRRDGLTRKSFNDKEQNGLWARMSLGPERPFEEFGEMACKKQNGKKSTKHESSKLWAF
jgi:hypothetical protein